MAARWAESLLELQAADLKIREYETRLTLLPQEMEALKSKRDAAVETVNAAANVAKQLERERKRVEAEIANLNDENTRLQQQSAMVKKNNEYQAMLGSIALNNQKIGDLESRVLELLDEFETAKKAYRKVKQENEAVVNALRSEFEDTLEFAKELKKELAELKTGRNPESVKGVDRDTLSRYEQLLNGKDAVAPLVKVENEICSSCHLRVTRQTMTNLQKGAITSCENCMHLIYLEEVE